jgi:hypothetical protein
MSIKNTLIRAKLNFLNTKWISPPRNAILRCMSRLPTTAYLKSRTVRNAAVNCRPLQSREAAAAHWTTRPTTYPLTTLHSTCLDSCVPSHHPGIRSAAPLVNVLAPFRSEWNKLAATCSRACSRALTSEPPPAQWRTPRVRHGSLAAPTIHIIRIFSHVSSFVDESIQFTYCRRVARVDHASSTSNSSCTCRAGFKIRRVLQVLFSTGSRCIQNRPHELAC